MSCNILEVFCCEDPINLIKIERCNITGDDIETDIYPALSLFKAVHSYQSNIPASETVSDSTAYITLESINASGLIISGKDLVGWSVEHEGCLYRITRVTDLIDYTCGCELCGFKVELQLLCRNCRNEEDK